ncbi:MAG: hypothetical protein MUE44_20160 [Oscillatoriaceae cyanobacterium Prado104]|nr:hypothetical protein [Oscillatoriaceae cyanobacterium Prado104]
MVGSTNSENLIGNGGKDSLTGGGGNDTLTLDPATAAGSKAQGGAGIDSLNLGATSLVLPLTPGQIGIGRSGSSAIIDLNKDGAIDVGQDIELLNFFAGVSGNLPGSGFIENVANLSGNAILAQFATTPTPAPTPTPTPTPRGPRILTPAIPIPVPNTTVDSIFNGGPLNDLLIGSNSQADALNGFAGSDTIYGLDAIWQCWQ